MTGQVRATMVAEDVWKTTPKNAQDTKIIGRYDNGKPALIVVRHDLDEGTGKELLAALIAWVPEWETVYGAFRPYLLRRRPSLFSRPQWSGCRHLILCKIRNHENCARRFEC